MLGASSTPHHGLPTTEGCEQSAARCGTGKAGCNDQGYRKENPAPAPCSSYGLAYRADHGENAQPGFSAKSLSHDTLRAGANQPQPFIECLETCQGRDGRGRGAA